MQKSQTVSSDDTARAARSMASVMPYADDWQQNLWSTVLGQRTASVTLRVKVVGGVVTQVQSVTDVCEQMCQVETRQ